MTRALVLGVGNILMQDEGVGVRTLEWLQAHYTFSDEAGQVGSVSDHEEVRDEIILLDGGTMGLSLLHYLAGVDHLLLLDAVEAGKSPGAIVELFDDAVPAFISLKLSPHQVGVQDLLATAQLLGYAPPEVVILGVQPAWLSVGLDMSPEVAAQIEPLARLAVTQLQRWGYRVG
jgi:hydrogenase maturation protease